MCSEEKLLCVPSSGENWQMLASDSPLPPFELPLKIQSSDIDELGRQQCCLPGVGAGRCYRSLEFLTTPEQRDRHVWAALRHEIDYLAEAVPGDAVFARTWTGLARGLRYPRHTE